LDQVRAALEELGVRDVDLRSAELQPKGSRSCAPRRRRAPLVVKVYGRDAWDGQLLTVDVVLPVVSG
jgi:hypothetical protein